MRYSYTHDPEYELDDYYDSADRHWTKARKHFRKFNRKEEQNWQKRARQLHQRRIRKIHNLYI